MVEHTSELIGLSENRGTILLDAAPSTVRVDLIGPQLLRSVLQKIASHSGSVQTLSLHILHIKGFQVVPLTNVYLNNENRPFNEKLLVGSLALYGLRKSSQDGGMGLHESWNVTENFKLAVQQKNWSDNSFTLSFVPQSQLSESTELSFERIELRLDRIEA